jgi:hypothetical protein
MFVAVFETIFRIRLEGIVRNPKVRRSKGTHNCFDLLIGLTRLHLQLSSNHWWLITASGNGSSSCYRGANIPRKSSCFTQLSSYLYENNSYSKVFSHPFSLFWRFSYLFLSQQWRRREPSRRYGSSLCLILSSHFFIHFCSSFIRSR